MFVVNKMPPHVMTPGEAIEGSTVFASRPDVSYWYRLALKPHDMVHIWLENCSTKQQWQTGDVDVNDIVSMRSNCIPNATVQDYIACFLDCLTSPLGSNDFARDLATPALEPDTRELRLSLTLQTPTATFSSVTWTALYVFTLHSVSLEPIRVLENKTRALEVTVEELQDHVSRLTTELKALQPPKLPVFFRATHSHKLTRNQPFAWERDAALASDQTAIELAPNGSIWFTVSATFVVTATIHHSSVRSAVVFEMFHNNASVLVSTQQDGSGYSQQMTGCQVVSVHPGDEVRVVYRGSGSTWPGSSIVLYQLR